MGVIKEDLSTGRRGGKKLWSTMLRTKDTDNETGFRFRVDRNGCRNEIDRNRSRSLLSCRANVLFA